MFHHSTTDYRVAASQAAARAREKFEAMIEKGRATGEAVFNQVHSQVPVDRVVRAERLKVRPDVDDAPGKFDIILPGIDPQPLHPHALRQVAEKAGMHGQYLTNLIKIHQDDPDGDWPAVLVANNLNTLLAHSRSRNLVRSVNSGGGEEVRGFLSDAFRRLDSRPLLDAFVEACQELGAVPVEGFALDTRVKLRAVLPHVFEPADNEVMLFGVEWSNSDFGAGGHTLSLFNTRIWCTNTAVMDEALRQVHLGRRLEDNIAYSQRTYDLDNRTNASALKDVVRDTLSPERVNGYLELVKEAVDARIDEKDVTRILKAKLGKGDAEKVQELFDGPDVVNLPPGNTKYRLSNAISWFSQTKDVSVDKKLDLQRLAGELLPKAKLKAREV